MNFYIAFDRLIGHEGAYTRGDGDPGGETNWGISKRSYPSVDIESLTREQAREIYRRDFWMPAHCEELPEGLRFQVFDLAVNSGVGTAIRYLQKALGVADDGRFGPITKAAAAAAKAGPVTMRLLAARLELMTLLSNWPMHGKGWARRIAGNLRYGAEDT